MLCGTCSADCKQRAPGECPEEQKMTKKMLRYVERGGTASIGLRDSDAWQSARQNLFDVSKAGNIICR